jgi:hypothetical protein
VQQLPEYVVRLLQQLDAPPRLVAHLVLVHDVALTLTQALDRRWPDVPYARLFSKTMHSTPPRITWPTSL